MSEQGTTKDLSMQADEQICEKLLGWKRADGGWIKQDGFMYGGCGTPDFTKPDGGELIVQALIARRLCIKMEYKPWGLAWEVRILTQEQALAGGSGNTWQEALRAAMYRYLDLVAHPWPSEPHAMHELRCKLLESRA